jgi:hypothetical protein
VRFSCFPTQSLHGHLVEVVPHGLWKTTWNFRTCWKSGIHHVLSTETTVLLMPNFRTAISSCVKLKNCFKLLTFWELASHKPKKTILGLFTWLVSFCQDNEQNFSLSSGIEFTWVRNKISITFRTPGRSIKLHYHLNTGNKFAWVQLPDCFQLRPAHVGCFEKERSDLYLCRHVPRTQGILRRLRQFYILTSNLMPE